MPIWHMIRAVAAIADLEDFITFSKWAR